MQIDIPLKRLMLLRAADLLPLFGLSQGELIAVETLELPASATRLDNVLRVRSPAGQGSCTLLNGNAIAILHCSSGSRAI